MVASLHADIEFLLDRLDEFERDLPDNELGSDYMDHVHPAKVRLRAYLSAAQPAPAPGVTDAMVERARQAVLHTNVFISPEHMRVALEAAALLPSQELHELPSKELGASQEAGALVAGECSEAAGRTLMPNEPTADHLRALFQMNSALPRTTDEAKAVYAELLNISKADATPPLPAQGTEPVAEVLEAGKAFGYDPATGFMHADDGGAPASCIFYVPKGEAVDSSALKADAEFLLDRLAEFEREIDGDWPFNTYNGHVSPAISRLRAALSTPPLPAQGTEPYADALEAGKAFGYDPATGFLHADDGGAPASCIFYIPKDEAPPVDSEALKAGMVPVPIKPTVAMLEAAAMERVRIKRDHDDDAIGGDYWRVMVRAALSTNQGSRSE